MPHLATMLRAQYRLGEEIGRGALGRVVRVHDDANAQVYAGKILHASRQSDVKACERFASEATVLSGVQNENIVRVYGIEIIDGESVMCMELIEGPTLAKLLALHGPMQDKQIISIAMQISSGLRAAHLAGLIHRDLKPQNILISKEGIAKVADFGMARAASFEGIDDNAFAVAGTPDYMAPECINPLAVDTRSDLYSLGCVLFEMATGRPPYPGATSFAVLEAHGKAPIPTITTGIGTALVELIESLLAKSPADRPQSAATVSRRLHEIQGGRQALVLSGKKELSTYKAMASGVCSECGQSLVSDISICFGCGAGRISLADGHCTLFITGPGEVGDKLDTQLRQKLLEWILVNPSLGLDPKTLAKKVPRLPFVLVTKESETTATILLAAIEKLGLRGRVEKGGKFSYAPMRKKSWIIGRRTAAVGAGTGFWLYSALGALTFPIVGLSFLASLAGGWYKAGKVVTKKRSSMIKALPAPIAKSMAGVSPIVKNMGLRRHRENLRGVVERVLALTKSLPKELLKESEVDLARLSDMALIATSRMDEIEMSIASADLRNPSEATLALMRERDRWAGRLLEVTAFLDSLHVRSVALKHGYLEEGDPLDELRAHIAALEEVQRI